MKGMKLFSLCSNNRHRKFAFYVKTRAILYPFVAGNNTVPVFVRRCVTMSDYLNNSRVRVNQIVNKMYQRLFLLGGPCVGRIPVFVQPANVANANRMFVVRFAGNAFCVAMCAVHCQRSSNLNGSIQINYKVVTDTRKAAFFVPFVNVRCTDIHSSACRRTMDNYCVNFLHRSFLV